MAQLRPKIVKLAKIIGGVTGITTRLDENTPAPHTPSRNPGPALLQKASSRSPSSCERAPFSTSSAAVRAPTG